LTKHIKKNHPQYSANPDVVSLASFGPETPQLGYTPSIGSSPPQTPSDNGEEDEYLPQPPNSYSYFPPQAGQPHPSYPSKPELRSKAHLHPQPSPGAWSADGRLEGGAKGAPAMSRSISQSSQSYLTPPPTHQTRFRSSRRQAAATRGRYKEYEQSEEEEEDELLQEDQIKQDEDDEEYVEGAGEPVVGAGNRQRRGAVAVGNSSRVSRRLHYQGQAPPPAGPWQQQQPSPHEQREQERYEQHQHQQEQQARSYGFAPPPPAPHHFIPSPVPSHHSDMMMQSPHEGFVSPPLHNLSAYSMSASQTAPMPQYEFEPHSHVHSPPLSFAAPPLRRASSFSALENASYPQQPQPYHHSTPGMLEGNHAASIGGGGGGGVELGLNLGSPFTPELHERRLSEMHNASLQAPQGTGYSYEVFQDYSSTGPASAVTAPLPSPSTFAFPQSSSGTVRPSSVGNTPRRGSIGFPSLPSHIQGHSTQDRAMYGNHQPLQQHHQQFETWVPPPQHRSTFSSMTSRLLEQEENNGGESSSNNGMIMSSY